MILALAIAIILFIIFLFYWREKTQKEWFESIKEQYPDGFLQWCQNNDLTMKEAYKLAERYIDDIRKLDIAEKELIRKTKEVHKRLMELYPHGYKRFTQIQSPHSPQDFKEMETRIAQLEKEYKTEETVKRIKESYPAGFSSWIHSNPNASNDAIAKAEGIIHEYDTIIQEIPLLDLSEVDYNAPPELYDMNFNHIGTILYQDNTVPVVHYKKPDASEILQYLKESGVTHFYHFTRRSNLESIKSHGGLFSWDYIKTHEIPAIPCGDDRSYNLIVNHGLQDYIHLSFCENHPMRYGLIVNKGYDLVLLKIDVQVAAFMDTRFTTVNAISKNQQNGPTLQDLKKVNIAATKLPYCPSDAPVFGARQAEVLVKRFIPIGYILNIDDPITITISKGAIEYQGTFGGIPYYQYAPIIIDNSHPIIQAKTQESHTIPDTDHSSEPDDFPF